MRLFAYFFASAGQSVGTFLMVALLVQTLSPTDFGRWMLLEPALMFISQVSMLGLNHGIIKLISDDELPAIPAVLLVLTRNAWAIAIGSLVAAALGYYWLRNVTGCLALALFVIGEASLGILIAACRAEQLATTYAVAVLLRIAGVLAILSLAKFSYWIGLGKVEHIAGLWGLLSFASIAVTARRLARASQPYGFHALHLEAYRNALRYGFPLLIAVCMSYVAANADRYVLGWYADTAVVGNYVVIAKASMALNFLLAPLNLWWPTARFRHFKDSDSGQLFFSRATVQMCLLLTTATGAMWLISPVLVEWLSPKAQYESTVASALCLAAWFSGMATPLNIGLAKEGHTHYTATAFAISAAILTVAEMLLVPRYGTEGAAIGVLISQVLNLAVLHCASQRFHYVSLSYVRLIIIPATLIGTAGLVRYLVPLSTIQLVSYFLVVVLLGTIWRRDIWPIAQ